MFKPKFWISLFLFVRALVLHRLSSSSLLLSLSRAAGRPVFHCSLHGVVGSVFSLPQQQAVSGESQQFATSQ